MHQPDLTRPGSLCRQPSLAQLNPAQGEQARCAPEVLAWGCSCSSASGGGRDSAAGSGECCAPSVSCSMRSVAATCTSREAKCEGRGRVWDWDVGMHGLMLAYRSVHATAQAFGQDACLMLVTFSVHATEHGSESKGAIWSTWRQNSSCIVWGSWLRHYLVQRQRHLHSASACNSAYHVRPVQMRRPSKHHSAAEKLTDHCFHHLIGPECSTCSAAEAPALTDSLKAAPLPSLATMLSRPRDEPSIRGTTGMPPWLICCCLACATVSADRGCDVEPCIAPSVSSRCA